MSTDYTCSDGHILRHIWVNARHKNRNHFVEGWQSSIEYAISTENIMNYNVNK